MKLKSSHDGGLLSKMCFSFCFGLSFAVPLKTGSEVRKNDPRRISVNPKDYLSKYGYIDGDLQRTTFHDRNVLKSAIRSFQEYNHLKRTGKIDKQTLRIMKQPRCGVPDIDELPASTSQYRRYKRASGFKNAVYSPYGLKWRSHTLSWRMTRYTNRLPQANQWATMKKAFELWEEPTSLTLTHNFTHSDIEVAFGRRSHGDGDQYAFDGRGPQLAHAFGPGDANIAGDVHFDDDERWTLGVNDSDSKDLFVVALHEAGHALGMPHSRDKKAIMYAQYKGYDPSTRLQYDDIRKIQYLYGGRTSPTNLALPTPPLVLPTPSTSTPNKTQGCSVPFDDVIYGLGGRGYVFSGRHLYRLTGVGVEKKRPKKSPFRVRKVLRGAPIHIAAAVYVTEKKRLYIFKGYRIWKYTRFRLEKDYPKKIRSNFPERPRAAVGVKDTTGNTQIYVFGIHYFWLYDEVGDKRNGPYMWTRTHWHGLPTLIDAVVQWEDGFLYFFSKDKYYKVSVPHRAVMAGYPKVKDGVWLKSNCRTLKT